MAKDFDYEDDFIFPYIEHTKSAVVEKTKVEKVVVITEETKRHYGDSSRVV